MALLQYLILSLLLATQLIQAVPNVTVTSLGAFGCWYYELHIGVGNPLGPGPNNWEISAPFFLTPTSSSNSSINGLHSTFALLQGKNSTHSSNNLILATNETLANSHRSCAYGVVQEYELSS